MLKELPNTMIDSATLVQEQDGKSFYYQVKFTVFGEVLSVEDDISDLPDIAKKLILGNQKEATISELQKGLSNLKYLVPLIALGEIYQLPDWLKPLEIGLQNLQKNIPQEIKKNPLDYISSEWVKQLINAKRYNFTNQRTTSVHFVKILLDDNILLNIPSIFETEMDIATEPLLEILEKHKNDNNIFTAIISTLGKSNHPKAYDTLTAILSNANHNHEKKVIAAKALSNMSFEKAKQPLFDALWDKNHWVRIQVVKSLRTFIQEEEVINTLIGVFRHESHQWVKVRAIEALGFSKNNKKVIRMLAQEIKTGTNEEIRFHTVQALKRIDSKDARFVLRNYYY